VGNSEVEKESKLEMLLLSLGRSYSSISVNIKNKSFKITILVL